MLPRTAFLFLVPVMLQAGELPAWWKALPGLPRMECDFVQESESAVFGRLKKEGHLQLARGGRIRVEYAHGILLVADGQSLIQYDPGAKTAQKMDLRAAARDMPLLNVLVNPEALKSAYNAVPAGGEKVQLEPRRRNLPKVELEGREGLLSRVVWTDATGAKQILDLKNSRIPSSDFPASTFTFRAPEGARWI